MVDLFYFSIYLIPIFEYKYEYKYEYLNGKITMRVIAGGDKDEKN